MRVAALCVSVAALAVAGCGSDNSDSSSKESAAAKPANAPDSARPAHRKARRGKFVKVAKTRYGRILVDGRGFALYLFTRDKGKTARCYGACAKAWPPFLTKGAPRYGKGTRKGALGTTRRRNGKRQVTYRGHPLYYYVSDKQPGQVLCQAVQEFGGYWYVVAPSGRAIQ
jgi:predicted lipoprotein with Yx(FWY)xxD motif